MTDYFSQIVQRMVQAHIDSPRLEARIIFAEVLGCRPDEICAGTEAGQDNMRRIDELVARRLAHYPLDKVLGHKAFYKSEFITNEQVLSPRPDTEILVEEAAGVIKEQNAGTILDLGTGSGCIILSLLLEFPQLCGTAADISQAALQTAAQNAERLGLKERVSFIQADWFAPDFCNRIAQKFDIIVSNPPYIPTQEIATLEVEVKEHEPLTALDGGNDGFDSYRQIAQVAPLLLNEGGYIFLEAGIYQAAEIARIFTNNGFKHMQTVPDLSGINRCVILKK